MRVMIKVLFRANITMLTLVPLLKHKICQKVDNRKFKAGLITDFNSEISQSFIIAFDGNCQVKYFILANDRGIAE